MQQTILHFRSLRDILNKLVEEAPELTPIQLKSTLSVIVEIVCTTTTTKNGVIFKVVNKDEAKQGRHTSK